MQRVISIVSRLAQACGSALTLRSSAESAAHVLVEHFPDSTVVFFERDPRGDTVRAVAGENIPVAWRMRAIHVDEVPLVREALRRSTRVVRGAVVRGSREDVPARTHGAGPMEVLCGAVPDSAPEPLHLLMFITAAIPGAINSALMFWS